jgi:hypothetical protein
MRPHGLYFAWNNAADCVENRIPGSREARGCGGISTLGSQAGAFQRRNEKVELIQYEAGWDDGGGLPDSGFMALPRRFGSAERRPASFETAPPIHPPYPILLIYHPSPSAQMASSLSTYHSHANAPRSLQTQWTFRKQPSLPSGNSDSSVSRAMQRSW